VKSKRWTLVAVVLGSGIVFLDSTIVPVALPRIGKELSSTLFETLEAQSYIYYGYLLSLSALLIIAGALTDYYGRKKMFTVGLAGFGVTSILCGIAPNMEVLIAGRVLQGVAGALLVPGSLAIITANFEGEEQGRAFGVWAGASAATTILGPVVGGALVASVSWRMAFWVNIPLIALALWATSAHVAESRDEEASSDFDWIGAVLAAVAVAGLTFGPIRGEAESWQGVVPFASLAIGALALIAFPLWLRRAEHPLVPLDVFRSRNFNVTNVSTFLIYGPIYVTIQFLALFCIGILGYNEVGFAVATLPSTLLLAAFSTRFGKLAARYGPRIFMTIGPALMGLGLLWLMRIPVTSEAWVVEFGDVSTWLPPGDYLNHILPSQLLFGAGLMIMVAPLTTALMRSISVHHSGVGSAFNNAVSRVAPQLVGAVLFVLVSTTFYAGVSSLVPEVPESRIRAEVTPMNSPETGDDSLRDAALRSSTDALHLAMLVTALSCLAGAAVNAVGIRNEQARETSPAATAESAPGPVAG
jgi:EmrB/QacA subfamily drug resistance transporter